MVVIRVELWPRGREDLKTELGRAVIFNDASGDHVHGNYGYEFVHKGRKFRSGVLTNFPRLRLNSFDLLFRALRDAVGSRNEPAKERLLE